MRGRYRSKRAVAALGALAMALAVTVAGLAHAQPAHSAFPLRLGSAARQVGAGQTAREE
jgi:hypothetical protein